jgi:hypothetical protein
VADTVRESGRFDKSHYGGGFGPAEFSVHRFGAAQSLKKRHVSYSGTILVGHGLSACTTSATL